MKKLIMLVENGLEINIIDTLTFKYMNFFYCQYFRNCVLSTVVTYFLQIFQFGLPCLS